MSPDSDKSAEMSPQKSFHHPRAPVDSRQRNPSTQGHHREEWRRPREHHRIKGSERPRNRDSRIRDRDERTGGRDQSGTQREESQWDRRRFDGRYGRQKKILPAPDYVVNPSKWTKYDLSNDGTEGLKESGMSDDQVNKFAAFQFLKELRERKERESGDRGKEEEGEGRVVFRKPKRLREEGASNPEGEGSDGKKKAVSMGGGFGSSGVLKMPEYVVGGGEKRRVRGLRKIRKGEEEGNFAVNGNKSKTVGVKPESCVSLSHLAEEEDD